MEFLNLANLLIGFVFTFFLPGFLVIQTFFKDLLPVQKLPFYLILSVLISTYTVFFVSLLIGYSKYSVFLSILIFVTWLFIYLVNRNFKVSFNKSFLIEHKVALSLAVITFCLFLTALYPAIFTIKDNYIVMSAVNWQDTAMHHSIIETITQGNFPPEAPYFSGHPLNYYYLVNLHSSILQVLYGNFFPRVLVYDNPFFSLSFFLAVYALSLYLFKSRVAGVLAALFAVFSGNFMFVRFFEDLIKTPGLSQNFFEILRDRVANHSYTLDYGKLMQMATMGDYFLQNRPMMVGLPTITLTIFALLKGFEGQRKYLILAGFLAGMLVKFQLFAFLVSFMVFGLAFLIFLRKDKKYVAQNILYFVSPIFLFVVLNTVLFKSSNYVVSTFLNNLRLGPWELGRDFGWYLMFPFANYGVIFSLFLIFIVTVALKKITVSKNIVYLIILAIVLYLLPHFVFFTIYEGDMLKFHYFLIIPLSLIAGYLLSRIIKQTKIAVILTVILLVVSSANSFLTMGWSFYNKNQAYTLEELDSGLWIRENTPQKSVFMTLPTVHSDVSEVGGRLRMLSYIVPPYNHGFNRGEDNVFSRLADIEFVYSDPSSERVKDILAKYAVNYIYVGNEERTKYPQALESLDKQPNLEKVYSSSQVTLYKVL